MHSMTMNSPSSCGDWSLGPSSRSRLVPVPGAALVHGCAVSISLTRKACTAFFGGQR